VETFVKSAHSTRDALLNLHRGRASVFDQDEIFTKSISRRSDVSMRTRPWQVIVVSVDNDNYCTENNKTNTAKFLRKSGAVWRQVNRKNCTCVCDGFCVCVSAWDFSSKRRDRNSSTSWTATGCIHRHCTGFQFRGDDIINVLCTGPSTSTRRRFSRISLVIVWW